ncbi:class I SAM-dependent methyltransferase [Endothiovibrio diazotrophicus]
MQVLLNLGEQPPSNRYLASGERSADCHPLVVGQCSACGLVQLIDPMPAQMVRSRFDWIQYNEPEGHCDRMVERVLSRVAGPAEISVLGLSSKDDSTLDRFRRAGVSHCRRLMPDADLGFAGVDADLGAIAERFDGELGASLATRFGRADIVVARHILEHARSPSRLVEACARLTRPGGLMLFEVPECRKFLEVGEYAFLWEEHISYFTPATLSALLAANGFSDAESVVEPYALEDSLIAVVRNVSSGERRRTEVAAEIARGERFSTMFEHRRRALKALVEEAVRRRRYPVLYGAGHLAIKWVNFYGLAGAFEGVIDDNPNKQGLRLPGSELPVLNSSILSDGRIGLCLLALSPESERRVVASHADFIERGGEFRSIFSASDIGLYQESAEVVDVVP